MRLQRQSTADVITIDTSAPLGKGGEARVYGVVGEPGLAAKVYEADKDLSERIAKLTVMRALPPDLPTGKDGHVSIAWPLDLLCDAEDTTRVTGFLMGRVHDASQVIDVYNPQTRLRETPLFDYRYLLRTARNLSAAVRACHARGYIIGDLKHSNVLVTQTALVTLVDTDSFQVHNPETGQIFACPVRTPDFTPPELQEEEKEGTGNRAQGTVGEESLSTINYQLSTPASSLCPVPCFLSPSHDLFALAVLIFHLLMEGTHPFAGVYLEEGDPPPFEERIARGHFPYGNRVVPYRANTRYAPPFDMLPPALRELFVRCFEDGYDNPDLRPDARTWQRALDEAGRNLSRCVANPQHFYSNHLDACPWCLRKETQLRGLDPFPSEQAVQERTKSPSPAPKGSSPAKPADDSQQAPPAVSSTASLSEVTGWASFIGGLILFCVFVIFTNNSDKHQASQSAEPTYAQIESMPVNQTMTSGSVPNSAPAVSAIRPVSAVPSGAVLQVAYSPDGKIIAGIGKDIVLWNGQSGKIKRRIPLNNPAFVDSHFGSAFAFAPDSKTLAVSSGNAAVKLWDVSSGKCRRTISVQGALFPLAYSHDGKLLAVGNQNRESEQGGHAIAVFDAHTGAWRQSLPATTNGVTMLCFSPRDDTLISVGFDSAVDPTRDPEWTKRFCIEGWDAANGDRLFLQKNYGTVSVLACSTDGKTFITHSSVSTAPYTTVWLRDMQTGSFLTDRSGKQSGSSPQYTRNASGKLSTEFPANVVYSPSRAKAAYIYNTNIVIYNAATWRTQSDLKATAAPKAQASAAPTMYTGFTSVAFSPDSDRVVTGSYTEGAQLWDTQRGKLLRTLERPENVRSVPASALKSKNR